MTNAVRVAWDQEETRATLHFSHPKGNIVTEEIVTALASALGSIARHPHLKLIAIEGDGPDFSFGASVPEHAPSEIGRVLPAMHRLVLSLLEARAVTAAVVRGRCLGGGFELALACDFIFASEDARLGLPEIALGVFPPAASVLLPLRAGLARATSAIVRGDPRSASEWQAAGLVDLVASSAHLAAEIDRWFEQHLAGRSAAALRYAAAGARHILLRQTREALPQLEQVYLNDLMRTEDAVEGVAAFLEKRQPRWTDR